MSLSRPDTRKTITNRQAVLTFGRYKGLSIEEILEINPDYLLYCQEHIEWFDLDHKILEEAETRPEDAEREIVMRNV